VLGGLLLALLVLAAIPYGIYWLVTNSDGIEAPNFAASEETPAGTPLNEVLASLYRDNTNTVFLVDMSRSIEDGGNLPVVRKALLGVVLPYVDEHSGPAVENSRAALMTFTDDTETLVDLASFEESSPAAAAWLSAVNDMVTHDKPGYIYDAVKDAHGLLEELDDPTRLNSIVLLTDGSDGGFNVIDPASATVCPPEVGAPAGQVCSRMSDSRTGEDAYVPFDPASPQSCPEQLDVAQGMVCSESSSVTSQTELLALLGSKGKVSNLILHTIGFGQEADQTLLKLLAKSGQYEGRYVYADR
jgi:hypothetical protein